MTKQPSPSPSRRRKRVVLPDWALILLGIFFLFATIGAAFLVYRGVRNFVGGLGGTNQTVVLPETPKGNDPDVPIVTPNTTGASDTEVIPETAGAGILPNFAIWNGTDRVTILLMGIDERKDEQENGYRTDTIMVITIDPVGKTASMLSIPRDLYVDIPDFGKYRINNANYLGDIYKLPGRGPQLAKDTIAANLGIEVDYYIRINFEAFVTIVDEIGGIDIDVPQTIDDPKYPDANYGYDPFYIEAGPQHLDGRQALKYARTRATAGSDFDRAKRQQDVIFGVRDKVLSTDMIGTVLTNTPALIRALAGSYDTDLQIDQIIGLAQLSAEIDRSNISGHVINQSYILGYETTPDGQQVVILDIFGFRELRDELFYIPARPQYTKEEILTKAPEEGAAIAVLNGSGQEGLATEAADYLTAKGFNVVTVGNADHGGYTASVLTDYTGRPYTVAWMLDKFQLNRGNVFTGSADDTEIDVELILGADFKVPSY